MKVKSVRGNFTFPIRSFPGTEKMDKADFIIISAKSYNPKKDLQDYSAQIKQIVKPGTIILVLQNGINMEEKLGKIFPDNPVLGGLAFTCINRIKPDEIHHIDYGQIKIGPLHKKFAKIAKQVTELFSRAGIDCIYEPNLRKARYEKLLWNVPFNSLSVLGNRASTKDIIEFPPLFSMAKKLMLEVIEIARKEKISLKKSLADVMLERTRKMKPYKTSMLLDYENGNPMEVESILGELYRNGQKLKAVTPGIEYTYSLLKFLNRNSG